MAILSHEYWKKFIEKDKNGKEELINVFEETQRPHFHDPRAPRFLLTDQGVMIIIETFGCIYRIKIYGLNAKIIQIQLQ